MSSHLGFKRNTQIFDWHVSHLMKDAENNHLHFNSQGDPHLYTEADVDYTLSIFETQSKNLHKAKMIASYHQKVMATLHALSKDLNLPNPDRVVSTYAQVTVSNTVKMLEKCKQLMEGRRLMIGVMRELELHEALVKDIREIADQQLSESLD